MIMGFWLITLIFPLINSVYYSTSLAGTITVILIKVSYKVYDVNKSVYIINLVLVTLLYVWIMSLYPFPNLYSLLYAVTSLIFLRVYVKRSRLSPFIPLFTFLYFFLYVIIKVNNVAYIHNLITSEDYLSLVGLIPGLLIVYKGDGNRGIIVNGVGIFIAYLYAMIIIFIFIRSPSPSFYSLPSNITEAFFIDPLFITAALSTARALGYGIPRRISGNYQNQPTLRLKVTRSRPINL